MFIVFGILAAAALGGIIYIFLSKKSSRIQKLFALGALVLSGLAVAICGVFLIVGKDASDKPDPYSFPLAVEAAKPGPKINVVALVIFLIILLAFFGFIIYIGIRDQKIRKKEEAASGKADLDF